MILLTLFGFLKDTFIVPSINNKLAKPDIISGPYASSFNQTAISAPSQISNNQRSIYTKLLKEFYNPKPLY